MARTVTKNQIKEAYRPEDKKALPKTSSGGFSCSQKITFNNTEFDSNVSQLLEFNFLDGLEFIGCTFNNGLFLKQLKVHGKLKFLNCRSPKLDQMRFGLHFQDIEIESLEIKECEFVHGIYFEKPSSIKVKNVINTFSITNGAYSHGGLNIVRTEIKSGFHFKGISSCENLIIKDCQIGKISDIENFRTNEIKIGGKDLLFKDNLNMWRVSDLNMLSITSGKFNGDIKIINPLISEHINLQNLEVLKTIVIDSRVEQSENYFECDLPEIYLKDCNVVDGVSINGDENECKKITIPFSPKLKGRLNFIGINFKEVYFTGTNTDNYISFNNCGLGKLHFDNFENLKTLSINSSNPNFQESNQAEIQITDSNLGTWVLSNFNFKTFSKIIWKDSLVSDLKTSSIKWFEEKTLHISGESDENTCFRRREFYRQLKLASEKEGDRISALEFKSRELKAYLNGLKVLGKKWWETDRITLLLGQTNNHGQNWILPFILVLIITSFIFYPLIFMAADPNISFWCGSCDFISLDTFGQKFWYYGSIWPSLFNPARRLNDLFPGIEVSFVLGFWDGLQRIVLAFFIFQIVSAFRKFAK